MPSGADAAPERLMIMSGQLSDETLHNLWDHYRITQRVSNRVFLVRGPPDPGGSLPEGLHMFSTADIPEDIVSLLDPHESLFVAAWRLRLQESAKKRPGEGLDWDTPGFRPPR